MLEDIKERLQKLNGVVSIQEKCELSVLLADSFIAHQLAVDELQNELGKMKLVDFTEEELLRRKKEESASLSESLGIETAGETEKSIVQKTIKKLWQ